MSENIVIGIEGLVGSGKTSICKNLLKYIPNSIVLHAGNIYRAITYQIMKENISKETLQSIDLKELFKKFEIEIKIENNESSVYSHGKKIEENDLQTLENSLAVSKISGIANNQNAYKLVKTYINLYKQNYNVIFSGRDIKNIYPETNYHFFITADIEKRIDWKAKQYPEFSREEIQQNIIMRDSLQKQTGYYKTYSDTIIVDVSDCKNINESTKKVLDHINIIS